MPPEHQLEHVDDETLASIFEERAENLSPDELRGWTAYTPRDEALIRKLMGPGLKLLTGPRGSGKSTLLKTAYYRLIDGREVLPVYVNYARSLALEPLFHKQANALQLFRQWLLLKVVAGVEQAVKDLHEQLPSDLESLAAEARAAIRRLEKGVDSETAGEGLSPSELVELIESWCDRLDLRRCVLLLDDAAHAFSPEQQREFFEVFRELRSRRISGKAAVYPGITSYSPTFHVGHEAELLEAWYRADDADYLTSMRSIVSKRLPPALSAKLEGKEDLVDYLALGAFGVPRGFLNMLSQLFGVDEAQSTTPTRAGAEAAISEHADSVRGIFRALAGKLPRYKHFVEVGEQLVEAMSHAVRAYNRLQSEPAKRTTIVAIEQPVTPELERMLGMLEYAGLVRQGETVSRGVIGRFRRYTVHHAILIADTALGLGRSFSVASVVDTLTNRSAHAFTRTKGNVLLGDDYRARCRLNLPACEACGAARISEDQHFCIKCGAALRDASVYKELLQADISVLPLTEARAQSIKAHTSLKTVQDVLLDEDHRQLRSVPYIGTVWSARIRNYAEEYVSV